MKTFLRLIVFVVLIFSTCLSGLNFAFAQIENEVKCGDKVKDVEFKGPHEKHEYYIQLKANGFLEVITEGVGDQLMIRTYVYSSSNKLIVTDGHRPRKLSVKTGELSQTALYKVVTESWDTGGLYSVSFVCSGITPDTKPTASPQKANKPVAQPQATTLPPATFSGFGVPAQSSVDFTNIESTIIKSGEIFEDSIDSTANTPKLFTVEAKSKQTLTLSYKRIAGNANDVNLGIAVLGPNNSLLFSASIVSTDEFNTKITVPADGKYTIGVYRVELNPPAKPKATSFELTATVK